MHAAYTPVRSLGAEFDGPTSFSFKMLTVRYICQSHRTVFFFFYMMFYNCTKKTQRERERGTQNFRTPFIQPRRVQRAYTVTWRRRNGLSYYCRCILLSWDICVRFEKKREADQGSNQHSRLFVELHRVTGLCIWCVLRIAQQLWQSYSCKR